MNTNDWFAARSSERKRKPSKTETRARAICQACPVRLECLAWATKTNQEGIWGGLSAPERRSYAGLPPDVMIAVHEAQAA